MSQSVHLKEAPHEVKDAFKIGEMLIPFELLDSYESLQGIDLTYF
jgi:hypothetical protein